MQTFITEATDTYSRMARALDNKRLHKQALEGWQILMNLLELDPEGNDRIPKGWSSHPAVKMWKGYEFHLTLYIQAMIKEWKYRGFKSTLSEKVAGTFSIGLMKGRIGSIESPPWIWDEEIASSHRQALLVKNYAWYSKFNWPEDTGTEPTEYTYTWPVGEHYENKQQAVSVLS